MPLRKLPKLQPSSQQKPAAQQRKPKQQSAMCVWACSSCVVPCAVALLVQNWQRPGHLGVTAQLRLRALVAMCREKECCLFEPVCMWLAGLAIPTWP